MIEKSKAITSYEAFGWMLMAMAGVLGALIVGTYLLPYHDPVQQCIFGLVILWATAFTFSSIASMAAKAVNDWRGKKEG